MPTNAEYWKKRFEQLEATQHQIGVSAYADIEKQYRKAERELESKINSWYGRFAKNNNVTLEEARKMLTNKELAELKWDVQEYIRYGEENALNGQWIKELENASARFHISRLEAMKIQMQQSLEVMFGNQLDTIDDAMHQAYKSGFYRTAYEVQKGCGVGWDFGTLDEKQIAKVINKPWAADGKNFSQRVWSNRQKLVNELNQTLTQNIVLGADPQKAIDQIAKRMNVSKNAAGRLVMTEEAFFSSEAQKDCFKELDVEEYEIVATLDSHTSEICRSLDGKHFPMKQWEVGSTAPPFHVYCRTTTVPYFEDDFGVPGERAARMADGEPTYHVPANMTYNQWQKSFLGGGDKSGLIPNVEGDIIDPKNIKNEHFKVLHETLKNKLKVNYNPVKKHTTPLNEDEIISSLGGGDKTSGSCASVGLAYIGQKLGLNVLDFRGGESQSFFSMYLNLKEITKFPNITTIFETARSSITVGNKLLKKVEKGKQYYLCVGRHAAIVQKTEEGKLQYLELQSEKHKGWNDFNGNPRFTLSSRFGCRNGRGVNEEGFMIDVNEMGESDEFQALLGYINTAAGSQKKGVGGHEK